MKSKKLIISFAIFLILVSCAAFFLNSFASKMVNKELFKNLPPEITYSDASVNVLGSQLTIKNALVEIEDEELIFFEEVTIGISYKDALAIIKNKEINRLEDIHLEFKNIRIDSEYEDLSNHKIASYVSFNYDGVLTKEIFQEIVSGFPPNQDQRLAVKISDFNFPLELADLEEFIPNIEKEIPTNCNFIIDFSSTKQQIRLQDLYINNKYVSTSLDFSIDYRGNSFDNLEPIKIDAKYGIDFNFNGLEIGDNEMSIVLGKGDMDFNVLISGNIEQMKEAEMLKNILSDINISFKDFKLQPSYEMIREIKRDIPSFNLKNNEIHISDIGGNAKWDGSRYINSFDLSSSLASINTDIDINVKFNRYGEPDMRRSEINTCVLRIGDLDESIELLINDFERQFLRGKLLPREGKDIVLNITGTFARPNIEGVDLN